MTALCNNEQSGGMKILKMVKIVESQPGLSGKHFHRAVLRVPVVPDKIPKGHMHLSDGHSNRGLFAVMDLQGVTAHSFKIIYPQFANVFEVGVIPGRISEPQVSVFMSNQMTLISVSTTNSLLTRRPTFTVWP